MRRIFWLVACLMVATTASAHQESVIQPPIDCDGAPADAVLQLPAPVGNWVRVICTETGHTLAPIDGDAWQIQRAAPQTAIAAGTGSNAAGKHGAYYVFAAVKEVDASEARAARRLFDDKAGFAAPVEANRVYALDLRDNHGKSDRIYIFATADGPLAGVACLGTCDRAVTVTVSHPEVVTP